MEYWPDIGEHTHNTVSIPDYRLYRADIFRCRRGGAIYVCMSKIDLPNGFC